MWILAAAWLAALLVFTSFFMKTMVPLRVVAIASNVAFITYALLGIHYGVFGRVYPILVLHSCLLPLNLVRLRQLRQLIAAVHDATDEDVVRSLLPYMRTEVHPEGTVLFRQGDVADRLYLVRSGTVRLVEIGKAVGEGEVLGEVGLFAPQGTRTLTAACETECRLATIAGDKVLELYYQDPRFGFFLIRLVAGRLLGDGRHLGDEPVQSSARA
jgi:CRP/FNR family transcriptional regulator, cyclic AMP receptor protein